MAMTYGEPRRPSVAGPRPGRRLRLGALLVAVALLALACGSDNGSNEKARGSTTTAPAGTGSSTTQMTGTAPPVTGSTVDQTALAPILVRALSNEQAAKTTYENVLAALGSVSPFDNIAPSEATHVSAVEALARTHGVDTSGATAAGRPSPATRGQACALGVDIEKATVAMYDELLPQVASYRDVVQVFTSLRAAAQDSHLPAFQRCA